MMHIIEDLDKAWPTIMKYKNTKNYFVFMYRGYQFKIAQSFDYYGRPSGKAKLTGEGRLFKMPNVPVGTPGYIGGFHKQRPIDDRSTLAGVKDFMEKTADLLDEKYAPYSECETFIPR